MTSLDDLPLARICSYYDPPYGGARRWTSPCDGWIVVESASDDTGAYWFFDPATRRLVAWAIEVNTGPVKCGGAIDGFQFPASCFDAGFVANPVELCAADGGVLD